MMRHSIVVSCMFFLCLSAAAQIEWTDIDIVCPCSLTSQDAQTAELQFGLHNHLELLADDLRITVAIAGEFTDPEHSYKQLALLDTIQLPLPVPALSTLPVTTTIDLGVIPNGRFYFELILHDTEEVEDATIIDSIWFKGEVVIPRSELSLVNMNYLVDRDEDGTDDLNEELESTNPDDPEDKPPPPVIDVLILHTPNSVKDFNLDADLLTLHTLSVTEYLFAQSNSELSFRVVGLLGQSDVDGLTDGESIFALQALTSTKKLALQDEFQSDITVVYRGPNEELCGVAEGIGGLGGRGFIHADTQAVYTEVFTDARFCSITVTAHEFGHLMGLGHSYNQGSIGTFDWSRGHGVEGEFGTIMTYAQSAYAANEVDTFSSPEIDCYGQPCGISHQHSNLEKSANASLSLNVVKYQVARTRMPDGSADHDGDGVGTDRDEFPLDPSEWQDSDGDGHGDNRDEFPNDPLEWVDTDGDGTGDNFDPDIDGDGQPNLIDPDPMDATVSEIKLLSIVSDKPGDSFGHTVTRLTDFDADGLDDIAVAAPRNSDLFGSENGVVYLFSFDRISTLPAIDQTPSGAVPLAELLDANDTWQIYGRVEDKMLGQQMLLLNHPSSSMRFAELLVMSDTSLYLIPIEITQLLAMDMKDGDLDRQIQLEHCELEHHCSQIDLRSNWSLEAMAPVGDFDNDGETDLGLLAYQWLNDRASLYLFSRADLHDHLQAHTEDSNTIPDLWRSIPTSFSIEAYRVGGAVDLKLLGDVSAGPQPEIGVGLSGQGSQRGRFYLLSMDQLTASATLDGDGDRRIPIDAFVQPLNSYKLTSEVDREFGRRVDVLNDVNGDGMQDVLVWGRPGQNYIFSTLAIRLLDIQDFQLDGSAAIDQAIEETTGVWRLRELSARNPQEQGIFRAPDDEAVASLVARYENDMLVAGLSNLDYLDEPSDAEPNGSITLPNRVRYDDVYQIRLPFGPWGLPSYGGLTSLGDLDKDQRLDFTLAVHSQDTRSESNSTLHVVFSSALPLLDAADEDTDHVVGLFDSFVDLDGDGIPNFFDHDNDGDGLNDQIDQYPMAAAHQFDTDGDGLANDLDAFPLEGWVQFDLDQDGLGDRLDDDIDGDGVQNWNDQFPNDTDNDGVANQLDLDDDGDGIPDSIDDYPLDTDNDRINNQEDLDDDSDGILDTDDSFLLDTDNDGVKNKTDLDDDGDGVADLEDAFPLDPTEFADTDGDGIGDTADQFADDATEWLDSDNDGIGDNADMDDDNDGFADRVDAFPLDKSEWKDSDGDGFGDNIDQFPHNHLEWKDSDGDGLGDQYGVAGFASYRLITPWFEDAQFTLEGTTAELRAIGDLDQDGAGDLLLSNGFLRANHSPLFLLGSNRLASLDVLEGYVDKTINLLQVQEEAGSWQLDNGRRGFGIAKSVLGYSAYLSSETHQDLVISGPTDFQGTGGSYMVPSSAFIARNNEDGERNGLVDYYECVKHARCTAIRTREAEHGLGTSVTVVNNYFGVSKSSLVLSTSDHETRRPSVRREGIPMVYIVSTDVIRSKLANAGDATLFVDDLMSDSQVIAIYPELDVFDQGSGKTTVMRLPDFDNDKIDDLVISQPNRDLFYIVASSDIRPADQADGDADGHIDLESIYAQPGSFKFTGHSFPQSDFTGTAGLDQTPGSIPLDYLTVRRANTTYLIKGDQLLMLDEADSASDGEIQSVSTDTDLGIWALSGIRSAFVCHEDMLTKSSRVLASTISVPQVFPTGRELLVYAVEVAKLADLDTADGQTDGRIRLNRSFNQGLENQWQIRFGHLANSIGGLHIACAGDLDQDGNQDYSITIKQSRPGTYEYQTTVLLLMFADLDLLDGLDGRKDYSVDVSVLWPEN